MLFYITNRGATDRADFTITNNISLIKGSKVILKEVFFPVHIYPIRDFNFDFSNNNYLDGANVNITVPDGDYSLDQLLDSLKNKMDTITSLTHTLTYNEITKKISIIPNMGPQTINKTNLYLGMKEGDNNDGSLMIDLNYKNNYVHFCSRELRELFQVNPQFSNPVNYVLDDEVFRFPLNKRIGENVILYSGDLGYEWELRDSHKENNKVISSLNVKLFGSDEKKLSFISNDRTHAYFLFEVI